jgi:glycosyltransferase involved in cell wall biosynthesis
MTGQKPKLLLTHQLSKLIASPMPHRIALIFEYPSLNGGEYSMLQTIEAVRVAHRGDPGEFEFIAIAPPLGPLADALAKRAIEHSPIHFHDSDGQRFSRDVISKQLVGILGQLAPDLVHANSLAMGRLTGAIQDQLTVPCVTHLRDILSLSAAAIKDINANRMIIAVSEATRSFHVAQGLDAARSCVVYNAVDCTRFAPREATGSLRQELTLPANSFIALTIGQIGLRKAQDVLAAAAADIAADVGNIHFVIVGQRNSTKAESIEFERYLAAEFERVGLGDRDHAIGYRDDVDRLLNEADLLVHPAKQEPLGRVLLEAAAAGLPIVATDVGGTGEILTDGESAKLIPPGDPGALAGAVIELACDPDLRTRYAEAARQNIEANFNASKTGAKLSELWRQLLKDDRAVSR